MEAAHLSLVLLLCLGVHSSSSEILKRQKRNWIIESFTIDEGYEGTFPYLLGKVNIENNLTFFRISGQGVEKDPKNVFSINENTGEIFVHRAVDYEKYTVIKLDFEALDKEKHVISTRLGVEILILDVNDNPPIFDQNIYKVKILESTLQGTVVTTVRAHDEDSMEDNRLFDLKIVSVIPKSSELEFYLKQNSERGTIHFRGCLDHEKIEKYTIVVEAKDHGKEKQLSSSAIVVIDIEDGNNHLPNFIGHTGSGRVKEGLENVLVSRLQVLDDDSKFTAAWRAKYQIQGDSNNNFRIDTDPKTNEGLLYVKKALDFEDTPMKNLTISVKNELPLYLCKVVSRSTTGLWQVKTVSEKTMTESLSTREVKVIVEDVNEPPIFDIIHKQVMVIENSEVGRYLWTFKAKDPDVASGNTVLYKKGHDPAGWVKVVYKTGEVSTTKIIDRESSFVKDSIYKVTIYAIDNGHPPMTGTATLTICITDENDNPPQLTKNTIDMCQSDGPSLANITAVDPDGDLNSGPFTFMLQGNQKGKWRLESTHGYSVNLVKESTVHSGIHELVLEVSDRQGKSAVHNLSVTVCNCADPAKPDCSIRIPSGPTFGGAAIGIIFLGILLLAGVLLLAFLMSCKNETIQIPDDLASEHLMISNIEKPGTDCKVTFDPPNKGYTQKEKNTQTISELGWMKETSPAVSIFQTHRGISQSEINQRMEYLNLVTNDSTRRQNFLRGNSMYRSLGATSAMRERHQLRNSMRGSWADRRRYTTNQEDALQRSVLLSTLNKTLYSLQAPGEELADYDPRVYVEEGDIKTNYKLDAISIPETPFDPDLDLNLGYRFHTLASICMPSERRETTTLIQN
ncbi:cadherin-like protein 26 [Plectropomus leopardus]|uniref:cadherin-like protein 26 n=1 Tax=Plectropomus leopardus TaxID=160734 RepID=UPI001C4A9A21|nr:cadherin-like protein 26 [Plectropomus leopardus]